MCDWDINILQVVYHINFSITSHPVNENSKPTWKATLMKYAPASNMIWRELQCFYHRRNPITIFTWIQKQILYCIMYNSQGNVHAIKQRLQRQIQLKLEHIIRCRWAPPWNLISRKANLAGRIDTLWPDDACMQQWTLNWAISNGLLPMRCQANTWTNAHFLSQKIFQWNFIWKLGFFIKENAFEMSSV